MATGPETKRLCSNRVETHTYREIHTEWGENWQNEKRAAVTFGSILVFSKGLFTRRQTRNLPFSPSGCLSRSLLLFQYALTTAVPSLLLNAIITATPTRPLAGPWRRPVMRNRQITTRLPSIHNHQKKSPVLSAQLNSLLQSPHSLSLLPLINQLFNSSWQSPPPPTQTRCYHQIDEAIHHLLPIRWTSTKVLQTNTQSPENEGR